MIRKCVVLLAFLVLACPGLRAAEGKVKILLIGKDRDHHFGEHEYMADSALLARCLRQTPGIETVVADGWPKDAAMLKDVKAIVLHTQMGGNVLFRGPQRRQAEELLKRGVGLTAIHWSTGADTGEVGDLWLHTLGGWFNHPAFSHYMVRTSKIRQADPKSPICRGWKDYDLKEEFYIDLKFLPEARPVLTAKVDGKDYPIGWVYERPASKGGRSFGFVGGHFHANFGEKPFRQALVNGILWTAHVDVPAAGAPCALRPHDMDLPPDTRKK
jgi:type 1 glutamine amidotransferase